MPAKFTIDQFCAELRERTEREGTKWVLTPTGRLRVTPTGYCPLQVTMQDAVGYIVEAQRKGMLSRDVDAVMDAADFRSTKYPEIRAQLLAAMGLA